MQIHGLGEDQPSFWAQLASALPAVATAAAQVITATRTPSIVTGTPSNPGGMIITGYQNGVPIYTQSSPAGVTPMNPYSLPSGMVNPIGVTPQYSPYGTVQSSPGIAGLDMTTLLLLGGAALLGIVLLSK